MSLSRSVHNTRIERLWYDVTHGFGQKWKNFFLELEAHCGLNPRNAVHIWLLHHLFLVSINVDAQQWAAAWNNHTLQIRGERNASPRDLFMFSMLRDGARGVNGILPEEVNVGDPALYGIDWQVADEPRFLNHLLQHNPDENHEGNPFANRPPTMADVPCEPPNCPFTPDQVRELDARLVLRVDLQSRDMNIRRLVWISALEICHVLWTE